MLLESLIVLALILLNGFFAMAELAVVSAPRPLLKARATAGSRGAASALALADEPTRFLSTVQIGITLIGIVAGAYGGATIAERLVVPLREWPMLAPWANEIAFTVVVVAITLLSLILGELVPKRIALAYPMKIATRVARPLALMARIGGPVVYALELATEGVVRALGLHRAQRRRVTDEDITALIAEGTEQGTVAPFEREMLEEVLALADRPVHTVMTHRSEIRWIDVATSPQALRELIASQPFGRLLVCDGSLDEVLGYVRIREVVAALLDRDQFDLRKLIREPLYVPESLKVLELLSRFRRARPHVALVVDEYGTIEGLVTPTDLLETVVGELAEEGTSGAPAAEQQPDGSWVLDSRFELSDADRLLWLIGLSRRERFSTLAGFLLDEIGRVP
ncbi:MAG TPA: hemolysin family protein, partial [Steroidobacteraceae bacterium]|nr:hemolysin family protein [Steroidobacteraceae bacterium]